MTVQRQIDDLIAVRAAEWYEWVRTGQSDQHGPFLEWLAESPRHMEAFLAISAEAPALRSAFRSGRFNLNETLAQSEPRVRPLVPRMDGAPRSINVNDRTGRTASAG